MKRGAKRDRLIEPIKADEPDDLLSTHLQMLAADIEDVFLDNGAKPGADYTYLDLVNLAVNLHGRLFAGASKEASTK